MNRGAPRGNRNAKTKATPEIVRMIRANPDAGYKALAEQTGLNPSTVRKIATGEAWAHIH